MLKTLRTKTRRVMLITLILVIPSFVFFYGWGSIQERQRERMIEYAHFTPAPEYKDMVEGWKDTVSVDERDMELARRQLLNQVAMFFGMDSMESLLRDLDTDVLFPIDETIEESINQWYLENLAEQKDITVSTEEIADILRQQFGGLTRYQINNFLQNQNFTHERYIEYLRKSERINRASQLIFSQAKVSYYDLWRAFLVRSEELQMDFRTFAASEYREDVQVSDENLKLYYEGHGEEFRVEDQRVYAYAMLPKRALRSQVPQPSRDLLREYYQENKEEDYFREQQVKVQHIWLPMETEPGMTPEEIQAITSETMKKAQLIVGRANQGEDFDELANIYSEDPANTSGTQEGEPVKLGGHIDAFVDRDMIRTYGWGFYEAATNLRVPGQISPPTETYGRGARAITIVRSTAIRPPGISPFEAVEDQVRIDWQNAQVDALFDEQFAEKSEEVFNYTTLEALANDFNWETGVTSWTAVSEPMITPGLFVSEMDLEFLNSELQVGDMSPLMQTGDVLYVLVVEDEMPSHVPEDFTTVRGQVEARYRTARARELARDAAEDFLSSLTLKDLATTATASEMGMETTDFFTRVEPSEAFTEPLHDIVMETFPVTTGTMQVTPAGMDPDEPDAFVVWHLRSMKTPDREAFREELPTLERALLLSRQRAILREWLWDLKQVTQVEKNEMYLED